MSGKFIPEYRLSKAEWSFADEPLHEGGADLGPRLNKMLCRDCGEPLILLSLMLNPVEDIQREKYDLIEHNRFYDERGRLVFAQVIFMDWVPCRERYQVRAWRLVKDANQVPERNWRTGGYTMTWMDGETLRKIEADSLRDSWTQFDPELAEREILPKEMRTELRKADEYIHLKLKQMSQP